MEHKIIIWECTKCGDVKISNPRQHHKMDVCKCNLTGMDLESYGCRVMGFPRIIKKIDLNKLDIMEELVKNCIEQGFYIEIDKKYIELPVFMWLGEIEKEILLDLI